jgi:ubiquinone/menaquinone biosynthesis C-methylase UbiE
VAEQIQTENKTQSFYDRIADVHNLAMKINGYRSSVAKYLESLDLKTDADSCVLDAGCGTGLVTLAFYAAGHRPRQTCSLDLSFKSLEVAKEQFEADEATEAENILPIQGNILAMPFADERFDLVLTCGVLEYVPLAEGLAEMARVLKPGKMLVLIPVRPSLVGSVLEILYNFKAHSIDAVREASAAHFEIVGNYKFPFTEPIGWSKTIFLLRKR